MIAGVVDDQLEATMRVSLIGTNGQFQEVTAVIDTGYNGMITLPVSIVAALALTPSASREVTLGDSSRRVFAYYTAEVVWDGLPRKVRVLCVEGDPLIGTTLLKDYKLEVEFVVGGKVLLTVV